MVSLAPNVQPWQSMRAHRIATCTLIYFYVREEPLNEAGSMLSRLLSYTTRLVFQVDPPSPDLEHFIALLTAALEPKGGEEHVDQQVGFWTQRVGNLVRESSTFSGLHNFFTKVERLLMTEELYDEINNVTIKPAERKIDEQSPFGHFLQRCLDEYLSLEDDEFAKVVGQVQQWVQGSGEHGWAGSEGHDTAEGSSSSTARRRRADYSLARAELEGFFDRSPLDSSGLTLQQTLLKNAFFHYRTKGFESARASLDESLRLSRGVNDLACISACDNLLRRIEYEEASQEQGRCAAQTRTREQPVFVLQDLWQVNRHIDEGHPLLSVLGGVGELLYQNKGKGQAQDQAASLEEIAECYLCQARTWSGVGVGSNAAACLESYSVEARLLNRSACESLDLSAAIEQSKALAEAGRYDKALFALMAQSLVQSLSMASFRLWQAQIWRLVYAAALQAQSGKTMDAVRAVRPEVVKEVEGVCEAVWQDTPALTEQNEASFDRDNRTTLQQELLGKLKEARMLRLQARNGSASLTMATQVMRRADEADLFPLYRQGALESAESLLQLGNATRARAVMDSIMAQLLVENSVETRGKGAWVYAKVLLALHGRKEAGVDAVEVLPWLQRAREAFRECGMAKELAEVLYVQTRLLGQLNKDQERDQGSAQLQAAVQEWQRSKATKVHLFETVSSIVRLVGAHVIAGA